MDWEEFSRKLNAKIDKTFVPTVQWMATKYIEMNEKLFDGELGECNFKVFTTGRGSQGGTLGWFKITGRNILVNRYSRRMYLNGWDKTFINRSNFVELCKPQIELNGNYSGTELGFTTTLVHEMCHYYTYMNGYCPKQGHGAEFKSIGSYVSNMSNGMFTIQRLASAEQMTQLELNDEMKAKKAKRLNNKKLNAIALIIYKKNGQVRLILTKSENLIQQILRIEEKRGDAIKIIKSNDQQLIGLLFGKGYKQLMRTYRFWDLKGNTSLLAEIDNANTEEVYVNPMFNVEPKIQNNKQKMIFSIKTSNGVFETEVTTPNDLKNKLRERFPKLSDEAIEKLFNNNANYRMVESKMNTRNIIKEVIDEFMENEFGNNGNTVEITPDMDLGKYSPLEIQ